MFPISSDQQIWLRKRTSSPTSRGTRLRTRLASERARWRSQKRAGGSNVLSTQLRLERQC
eukprot:4428259-Pleurochrysis_carterae.AAC.2